MPAPRLLIADDNPPSLAFLLEAARSLGYACEGADDGHAALAVATREAFDLLLLDRNMPGLSGPEVLAALRAKHGPSAATPALATTADPGDATRRALLAAGFAEVLVKPLGLAELRAMLARHVPLATPEFSLLDDGEALRAAGGDAAIVSGLRGLFAAELAALPAELEAITASGDREALRARLHRLDASAGFCGAPAIRRDCEALRRALPGDAWPDAPVAHLLATCREVAALLATNA